MSARHVAALCSMLLAACGRGGPKVALRYHPPANAVYHIAVEQRTQVSIDSGPTLLTTMGKQSMLSRMLFTQTVKGPASGGGTEVEIVFESMTVEMPGIPSAAIARELAKLNGLRATVVIDERGQVVRNDFAKSDIPPDMARQMEAGIQAMSLGFPGQPVGPGDSWVQTTELPLQQVPGVDASSAGPAKATTTIREVRIAGADTTVIMDMKMEFPTGPITVRFGNEWGTLRITGDVNGHQQYSMARGVMLDGTVKGATRLRISAPSFVSTPLVMLTETESSIVLLP
jgi:hypothetical protein